MKKDRHDELREDSAPKEKTRIQEKAAAVPQKTWDIIVVLSGIAVGAAGGYFMFFANNGSQDDMWNMIYACILLLIVPRSMETWVDRSVQKGRVSMCAVFVVALLIRVFLLLLKPAA